MTSLAEFVWTEGIKLFGGDILTAGLVTIIAFAFIFFMLRLNLPTAMLLGIVLLDGMVGANYAVSDADGVREAGFEISYSGAFGGEEILTGLLILFYIVIASIFVIQGVMKIINR